MLRRESAAAAMAMSMTVTMTMPVAMAMGWPVVPASRLVRVMPPVVGFL